MATSKAWKEATAGTYLDAGAPRAVALVFVVLALVLALVPLVGMVWARTDSTTENHALAALPAATNEDGSVNVNALPELGAYYEDHFAYRNQAVTANAFIRAALGTSATDQVVIGSDGWLYYGGELPDYLGQSSLSDRSLANIAHNLKLASSYIESRGAKFAFTIAPNKSSLDPSHMPYYYVRYPGDSNAERLKPLLEREGVNYVDLFNALQAEQDRSGFGYLKLDSHWDNRWALIAENELLKAVGHDALPMNPNEAVRRTDFYGDLQSMLYPAAPQLEANYYYEAYNDGEGASLNWAYEEGDDVTDSTIATVARDGALASGGLLMFRDSFGNALLPFQASAFERAMFSKLIPYNLTQAVQVKPDAVIVERAERHVSYLAANPPIMPNPQCSLPKDAREADAKIDITTSGSYWVVKGLVNEPLDSDDCVFYLVIDRPEGGDLVIDPFWTSGQDARGVITDEQGFLAYIPSAAVDLNNTSVRFYRRG